MAVWVWQAIQAVLAKETLPPCLFHHVTGYPCPTCGTTRAFLAACGGDWAAAVAYNPLVVLGGTGLAVYLAAGLLVRARTGRFPEPRWTPRRLVLLRASFGVAITANWAYLVLAGI